MASMMVVNPAIWKRGLIPNIESPFSTQFHNPHVQSEGVPGGAPLSNTEKYPCVNGTGFGCPGFRCLILVNIE